MPSRLTDPTPELPAARRTIRLLVVEDSQLDYELMLATLSREPFDIVARRVEERTELLDALREAAWDAVISDHHLPRLSSTEALEIVRASGSSLPFIIVSGLIGEDTAVAAMRSGADDYLVKGRLARLGPALLNALAAAEARRERLEAMRALEESQHQLRELLAHLDAVVEEERAAIAREIHDDIGGLLTALRFDLSWIERRGDPKSAQRAHYAKQTLTQAMHAAQCIQRNLRPAVLDAGLVAALHWQIEEFRRRTSLRVDFSCNVESLALETASAMTLYRTLQEAHQRIEACARLDGASRARGERRPVVTRGRRRRHRTARAGPEEAGIVRPSRNVRARGTCRRLDRRHSGGTRHLRAAVAADPSRRRTHRGRHAMIRVVLVDDHALIRRGLRETLSDAGGIEVTGEAGDYAELRTLLRKVVCDVMLLDLNLPGRGGIDVLASLASEASTVRVVVLSQYPEDQYGIRALRAGAMAYLNKSAEPQQIIEAVRTVAAGRKYLTPEIAHLLLDSVTGRIGDAPHDQLSEREMQTLLMIAAGRRLSEIATALTLSPKTVSVYRARVLEKLGVSSNAELASYALRHRLID